MPAKRNEKVKFGVPLAEALKDDTIPIPLVEILVHIAQEGVTSVGLFRRPGNVLEQKTIVKRLMEGKPVNCTNHSHYTLTGVIKKFLLKIPGGVFGAEAEASLLEVLDIPDKQEQYDKIQGVMASLPSPTQHFLVLLFGTWFRTVHHVQYSSMSSEALGKSVAGSMFHTCASDQHRAERAARVLKLMIEDFGVTCLFGRDNLNYFAAVSGTGLKVQERFRYEFHYPTSADNETTDKYLHCFATYLQLEAKRRGFDIDNDGKADEDGNGVISSLTLPRSHRERSYDTVLSSTSTSPQQDQAVFRDGAHRSLRHTSSVSAPDVNKLQTSPVPQMTSSMTATQLATNASSFDTVKRRQLVHMKMRANWFLAGGGDAAAADGETQVVADISTATQGNGDECGPPEIPATRVGDGDIEPATTRSNSESGMLAKHCSTDNGGGRHGHCLTPVNGDYTTAFDAPTHSSAHKGASSAYQSSVCHFVCERTYGGRLNGQTASCS